MASSDQWTLSFDEEFTNLSASPTPGAATWSTKYWWGGRALSTGSEYYLDDTVGNLGLTPFVVNNGILTMTAQATDPQLTAVGVTQPFTSGQLDTFNTFSQQYGYFEARMKASNTFGTDSALWLLPQNGSWPPELDLAEVRGREPDRLVMSSHTAAQGIVENHPKVAHTADLSQDFHTFGFEWNPVETIWYLDGKEQARTPTQADQHQPMYLLATLGIGQIDWVGIPNPVGFQAQMSIDYIRAYTSTPGAVAAAGGEGMHPLMGKDTVTVRAAADTFRDAATFDLQVDGKTVGTTAAVTGSHADGQWQDYVFHLDLPATAGSHVGVQFTNDAFDGTVGHDRNLYVADISVNDHWLGTGEHALMHNGAVAFAMT
jgi:beta-glucanase (GH16 family)